MLNFITCYITDFKFKVNYNIHQIHFLLFDQYIIIID